MARVFLDTNYFIDALSRKPDKEILESLENHIIYTSALSFHIYCYVYKIVIPDVRITAQRDKFQIVEFSERILDRTLDGQKKDFEDNIQLHSAAQAECEYFLTEDKKLLNIKFFGKVRIVSELSKP